MGRLMVWALIGAMVGLTVATLFAPSALEALLATTGAQDAMCQCTELVRRTSTTLIQVQLTGSAVGAVTFPIFAWLVRRKFKKPEQGPAPSAA